MMNAANTRLNQEQRYQARNVARNRGLLAGLPARRTPLARAGRYFTLALFGIFALMLMAGLWIGVSVFREGTNQQQQTNQERLALNSLQNRVRSADAQGAFAVAEGPQGKAMVFSMPTDAGTYETRIYLYQGALVQELAFDTDPYMPNIATTIVETENFEFTLNGSLLEISTDQGTAYVALRSSDPAKGGV